MQYYEGTGHPELAHDFYRELRSFMLDAARRPGRYHYSTTSMPTSGGSISNASLITSYFELWAIARGSLSWIREPRNYGLTPPMEGPVLKAAFEELTRLYHAEHVHGMPVRPPEISE
jgi:hypothetical protein